jgi:signal transduction histidine kinase
MQALIDYDGASVLTLESDALRMLDSRRPGYGSNEADIAALTIPVQRTGSIWQLLRRNEPVNIPDVTTDDALAMDYRHMIADAIDTTFSGVRSWLAVPLAVKERTIGTLTVSHKTAGHFKEAHLRLARAIADQAAVAIDNARLYGRAQELAAVEERQRLARELHDSVSQALYGIALGARTARTLLDRDPERAKDPVEYVMSLAEAGLAEMRALIFELRPESLELEGLVAALDKQAAAMRARHNVRVDTVLCDEPDIPLEVKQTISRIAQEALHNIVKHARATSVDLTLECSDDEVMFEIRDDGSGFDPVGDFAGHLGLRSMRERAASLGGRVDIESAPGAGSRIRLTIPVEVTRAAV